MLGKYHTEESKEKMREYAKNRPIEVNKKIGEKTKQRFSNPENNPRYGTGRHVIQLSLNGEYITEYVSADEAQRKTGINRSNIRQCYNGRYQTAGGFIWMYKDIYDDL